MGTIVATFFQTLDGVVESPHEWHGPYFNEQMGAAMDANQAATEAVLMGRVLYEQWSSYWPDKTDADDEYAGFINTIPKYVVSRSLQEPSWAGTRVVRDAAGVREVKERVAGVIGMQGSATTLRWLLSEGLVDELNLFVDPVIVGAGQRLFEGEQPQSLTLTASDVFDNGVLHLRYAPSG